MDKIEDPDQEIYCPKCNTTNSNDVLVKTSFVGEIMVVDSKQCKCGYDFSRGDTDGFIWSDNP